MELAVVPRRRPWSVGARLALVLLVISPVTLLALLPAAVGLERYVITADDMGPGLGRGSVAFERLVPVSDLAEGDVVTLAPTGPVDPAEPAASSPETGLVTQRVVEVGGGSLTTRADEAPAGAATVVEGRTTVSRLVVAVPLVGYPFIAGIGSLAWAASVVLGLALGVLFLRDAWRPVRRPAQGPVRRPARVPAGSAT